MDDFHQAVILITGAASGIGAATASRLAGAGARKLILADRDEDRLREFAFSLPCERQMMIGAVEDEYLWAQADLTGLTHAVINAGIADSAPIDSLSFEAWRTVMAINLDGAFLSLRAAMRAIRSSGPGGSIVLTASVAGLKAVAGTAAYAASKAGVIQLAKVAAQEGASSGLRVNALAPGGVATPIWTELPFFNELVESSGGVEQAFEAMGRMATPLGRYAKPEEMAEQVAFLLSERSAFTTGACLVSDGGFSL